MRTLTLILAAILCAAPARAGELFDLGPRDGGLGFEPKNTNDVTRVIPTGNDQTWSITKTSCAFEHSAPPGYFNGRVCLQWEPGKLGLRGVRYQKVAALQVVNFDLIQTDKVAAVEYVVRTPPGQQDVYVHVVERNLTLLFVRHPELKYFVKDILDTIGDGAYFSFDPALKYQLDPDSWEPKPDTAALVGRYIKDLESPDHNRRVRAEDALFELGEDAYLYILLRYDRSGLTPEQQLVLERVVQTHITVLPKDDLERCRTNPSILEWDNMAAIPEPVAVETPSATMQSETGRNAWGMPELGQEEDENAPNPDRDEEDD